MKSESDVYSPIELKSGSGIASPLSLVWLKTLWDGNGWLCTPKLVPNESTVTNHDTFSWVVVTRATYSQPYHGYATESGIQHSLFRRFLHDYVRKQMGSMYSESEQQQSKGCTEPRSLLNQCLYIQMIVYIAVAGCQENSNFPCNTRHKVTSFYERKVYKYRLHNEVKVSMQFTPPRAI